MQARVEGKGLYFISALFQNDARGELLYCCQPPRYPTLICITIIVSPIEPPASNSRSAVTRDLEVRLSANRKSDYKLT